MRVSIVNSEHLLQGMIVAEDVYTQENQMILSHGMVLTPHLIYLLKDKSIRKVKICSEFVSVWEYQPDEHTYSSRVTRSDEYRRFDYAYQRLKDMFEAYIYHGIQEGDFGAASELVKNIRETCQYSSDKVHTLEMLIHRERLDHPWTVHSINVAILSYVCGKEMGLTDIELDTMILAGLLHDIGRVMTPDVRIRKPDMEAFEELLRSQDIQHMMPEHIRYGYELLNSHGFDERICNAALYHHEWFDESGYIDDKGRDDMDLYARMVAIADMAERIVLANFEEARENIFKALEILEYLGREKFDRKVLSFCMRRIAELYLHHIVMLSNGIKGEVVAINKNDLARPIVKTNYGYIDLGKTRQLEIAQIY